MTQLCRLRKDFFRLIVFTMGQLPKQWVLRVNELSRSHQADLGLSTTGRSFGSWTYS